MKKKVRKAVIPAAGLGTRVLPATKAQPKEMLVIVDKPALQYLVEELIAAGIEEILIITGRNKGSIENHFDYSYELEKTLEENGKKDLLKIVDGISEMSNIYYVRQKKPLGLGHAISCAEAFVGDEPFVVLLGDDIIYTDKDKGQSPVTKQLIEKYEDLQGGTILGVQEVDKKNVSKYGIIKPLTQIDDKTVVVEDFIEKPTIEEAPSNLAALGRYVLEPEIFSYLKNTKPGKGGEIQLTDAILAMKNDGGKLYAYNFEGLRYDTGDKFGMFVANVEFGLRHEELKDRVREYLKDLIEIIKDRDLVILLVIGILLGIEKNNFEKVYLGWCAFSMPLLILYIVEDYFKKELIGFGDVKLMIVIGGLLKYRDFRQVLFFYQNLYFLSAAIVVLVLVYWRMREKRGEYVPFAPYIILNYLLFEKFFM